MTVMGGGFTSLPRWQRTQSCLHQSQLEQRQCALRATREAKNPKRFKSMDEARAHLMNERQWPTLQTFLNWVSEGVWLDCQQLCW